jgi:hypothetical protein
MMDSVAAYESQLDSMIEDDDDLQSYVGRLETMSDSGMSIDDDDDFDLEDDDTQLQFDFATDSGDDAVDLTDADVGDTDALMEEVEQFLRDQDGR